MEKTIEVKISLVDLLPPEFFTDENFRDSIMSEIAAQYQFHYDAASRTARIAEETTDHRYRAELARILHMHRVGVVAFGLAIEVADAVAPEVVCPSEATH